MKKWKATFWTDTGYHTICIRRRNIHFVVILLETLITKNDWELVFLEEIY